MPKTTILIENQKREKLRQIGKKDQTYDAVINDLIETRRTSQDPLDSRLRSLQSSEPSSP
jgi:hypothetical protein